MINRNLAHKWKLCLVLFFTKDYECESILTMFG